MEMQSPSKKLLKQFGLKLREIREKKDLSLEGAEELCEISWQYIQKLESGRNTTLTTIFKIGKGYNVTLTELFKELKL